MGRTLGRIFAATWTRTPYWVIGVAGACATLGYVLGRVPDYRNFWAMGAMVRFPDGSGVRIPFTRVLVDLTIALMGLSFIIRRPPRERNHNPVEVLLAALGGCMPMLPYFLDDILGAVAPPWRAAWKPLFMDQNVAWWRSVAGATCLLVGNAVDVWAYVVLSRSFSVVPEARDVVTRGPYRWVRHPVYAGQLLGQAGIWVFFAVPHGGWLVFYAVFVLVQMYRARAEERVLLAVLGDAYRAYATRAWWLWRIPPSAPGLRVDGGRAPMAP